MGVQPLRHPAHRLFERQICGSSCAARAVCVNNQSISASAFELFCKIKKSDIIDLSWGFYHDNSLEETFKLDLVELRTD